MAKTTNIAELSKRASMPAREAGGGTVAEFFEQNKQSMAAVLPSHVSADRMLKIALQAIRTTPALMECTTKSLMGAVIQCATMGLEPNTVLGHAYLVPFNRKIKGKGGEKDRWVKDVQVIVGYKGMIDLARRSGQIVSIAAHPVYQRDEFSVELGTSDRIHHIPSLDENRGNVIAYYAVAKFRDGGHAFEVMSKHEVDVIMLGTQSEGQYGPWKDNPVEMGRKTVIRRLAKYLPMSVEMAAAVEIDGLAEAGKPQNLESVLDGEYTVETGGSKAQGDEDGQNDGPTYAEIAKQINEAATVDAVNEALDLARALPNEQQEELSGMASGRKAALSADEIKF